MPRRNANDYMTELQQKTAVSELKRVIQDIERGRVKWWAVSVRFLNGATVAIHSEHAPNRPRGLG